jgi:anti-anti-sigma factor
MDITISQMQGRVPVTVLHVTGEVDSSNYMEFSSAMRKAIDGGADYLLIDMGKVSFISSAGIRSLNEIWLLLKKKHPPKKENQGPLSLHLKLLNPTVNVSDELKLSGVDAFFELHTDLDKAIASF